MDWKYEVFISYRCRDPEFTRWVRQVFHPVLRRQLSDVAGVLHPRVFLDVGLVPPGDKYREVIHDALRTSKVLVVLLVPAYVESDWCATEFMHFSDTERPIWIARCTPFTEYSTLPGNDDLRLDQRQMRDLTSFMHLRTEAAANARRTFLEAIRSAAGEIKAKLDHVPDAAPDQPVRDLRGKRNPVERPRWSDG